MSAAPRKFSQAAVDATVTTAIAAAASSIASPSSPRAVPNGEWLTGRVPGKGASSVKRDVVVLDSEDEDFAGPAPFKRGKIDETLIEPVDLFKELSRDQQVSFPLPCVVLALVAEVALLRCGQTVMDLVMAGKNVFFTGSAGTGKSFLLKRLVTALRDKHDTTSVFVTASTGIAACAIDGVTVHRFVSFPFALFICCFVSRCWVAINVGFLCSFGGVGLAKESAEVLADKVMKSRNARLRWLEAKVLIIDEISMIDGVLFDKLEVIARTVRRSSKPFGGIQVLLSGGLLTERGDVHSHGNCVTDG